MKNRALIAAIPLLAACADGPADDAWSGTVVDSAGVPVVMNTAEGLWGPGEAWTLQEELSIGMLEGELAYQFGQITGMDVDEAGNVYVSDMQAGEVRVFDAQGTWLRTLGRPGSGPGELGMQIQGVFVTGDEVLVPDLTNFRVARMSLTGDWLGSTRIEVTEGFPARWDENAPGSLVAQLRHMTLSDTLEAPRGDAIVVFDTTGVAGDTVAHLPAGLSLQFRGGRPQVRVFDAEPVWDASEDGRVVMGMNNAFRIEVRDAAGTLEHVVTLPFATRPVTERDRGVFLDLISEALDQQGLPTGTIEAFLGQFEFAENYPAFATVLSGPDRTLWVQRIRTGDELAGEDDDATFDPQDLGSNAWDVFDPEGRYLGVVEFPPRFQPVRTLHGRFYGVGRDELDIQTLDVYRVLRGAAGT